MPALLAILMPEATAYHLPWLREQPENYSSAVRERLELGAITPAVSYIQGQQVRRRIVDEFLAAMEAVDLLVTPTGPTAATPLEGDLITGDEADPAGARGADQLLRAVRSDRISRGLDSLRVHRRRVPVGIAAGGATVAGEAAWLPRTPTSRRPTGIAVSGGASIVTAVDLIDGELRGRSARLPVVAAARLTLRGGRDKMPRTCSESRRGSRSFVDNELSPNPTE